jgi:hypothetical protein
MRGLMQLAHKLNLGFGYAAVGLDEVNKKLIKNTSIIHCTVIRWGER